MELRKIRIGFSSPQGIFNPLSWGIKLVQGWWGASHTYIRYESQSGIPMVYQASGKMTNFMALHNFKKIANIEYEYELEVTEEEYKLLMWEFDIMAGIPYSTTQLVGILLKDIFKINPFRNGNQAAICTEIVAGVLKNQDFKIKNIEELKPKQLFDICKRELDDVTQR